MKLTTFYLTCATLLATGSITAQNSSDSKIIYLDLANATTELTFDSTNGMWEGTFDDEETEIESQVFSISHGSWSEYNTWWGFTASNSTDNKYQSNTLTYQYSNMALGGILLNEDGSIKLNEFGAPETSKDMPYLVGFCDTSMFGPAEITIDSDKVYEMVGAYVNLNSYTYYSILYGASPARAFTQGDYLILKITGVDSDDNEKTVEVKLASFDNGSLTACNGWMYVDLEELGIVEELKFAITGSDVGTYGLNTPSYFCLDKLAVREVMGSGVKNEILASNNKIVYDNKTYTIDLGNEDFAIIYDSTGRVVMTSSDKKSFSVSHLPGGVYVVKSGNNRLKFVR